MNTVHILEAATLVESSTDSDTWRVRLIQEGQGSSGYYSAELLENYGRAFDDTISFLNHTDDPSSRNFTEIAGRVMGATWTEKDKDGKVGVYANWRPDDDHRRKLEQYKDTLGLSIFICGEGRYDEADNRFVVESFDEADPYRSVDVVIAPGANGRFLESMKKVYSSRVEENERPGARQAEEKKEIKMDKELQEALDAITEALAVLVAEKSQKESEEAQTVADETAVASAVEAYAVAVKAVDEADLFESQRASLLEAAKAGGDISEAIENAKRVKAEAVEAAQAVSEGAGRTIGDETKKFSLTQIAEGK